MLKWLAYTSGTVVRKAHAAEVARVIMYHGVGDDALPGGVFAQQIKWLRANFEVLPLGTPRRSPGCGRHADREGDRAHLR